MGTQGGHQIGSALTAPRSVSYSLSWQQSTSRCDQDTPGDTACVHPIGAVMPRGLVLSVSAHFPAMDSWPSPKQDFSLGRGAMAGGGGAASAKGQAGLRRRVKGALTRGCGDTRGPAALLDPTDLTCT